MPDRNSVPKIQMENVFKAFAVEGEPKPILHDVSLRVGRGELVSIIGPSGCGKSTLLHIIAGLEEADKGMIKVDGNATAARLGHIGYMQQKDLLLPWRTVLDNVILGLELQGASRPEARKEALKLTETFGLKGFERQYPFVLSGGMRQRAALLRSVLLQQDIVLLDEPFGALDALTRHKMQEWLINLWRKLGNTIILVTHDIDEALLLSDRVYVLSARPATVAMSLEVDLPRPRNHTTFMNPAFAKLKSSLVNQLHEQPSVLV